MWDVRVKQLNYDKGTNRWNLVMEPTLDLRDSVQSI